MTRSPIGFTGAPLDRADPVRTSPSRLAAARADPRARQLLLAGLDPVPAGGGRIARGPVDTAAELALLGVEARGQPLFVALEAGDGPSGPPSWDLILDLTDEEMAIFAAARSLIDWHRRHPFCAQSGHPTEVYRGGWGRRCPTCGAEHFPRVDPVVIMLAEHRGQVLVARQSRFPARRFSALAGFVEPGESVEEAVARELFEEAGVRARDVRYLASQPWPFPSQLMLACLAKADDDRLTLDGQELEAAMWVSRDEVRAALEGAQGARFDPPGGHAIARTLLERWATGDR